MVSLHDGDTIEMVSLQEGDPIEMVSPCRYRACTRLPRAHPPAQPLLAPRALALQRLPLHLAAVLDRFLRSGHGGASCTMRGAEAEVVPPLPFPPGDRCW